MTTKNLIELSADETYFYDRLLTIHHPSEFYVFHQQINEGATCRIMKAYHHEHGSVAVKVYHPEYRFNSRNELPFLFKTQGHINFPKVYDTWDDDDHTYIVMELMDGCLLDLIEIGMHFGEIVNCVQQLIHSLVYLDVLGIVHFDLKPENIGFIRASDGSILYKIIDFGSAYTFDTTCTECFQHEMNTNQLVLTSLYYRPYEAMIPDGVQLHTNKSDIWSFGAIVYEMITGIPLFKDIDEYNTTLCNEYIFKNAINTVKSMYVSCYEMDWLKKMMILCLNPKVCDRISISDLYQMC